MTVFVDIIFFIGIGIVCLIILYVIYNAFLKPWWMRYVKGKKQYKSERMPSIGGIKPHYYWFKTDEEAIKALNHMDFIWRVYPGNKEKLKPDE